MIYRGKIFIEGDLACFINKKMSISEEDAELEAYHEESFEIPFLNGVVAEIRFCFDGSGWADGRLYDRNGDVIYQDEPLSEFFGTRIWTLVDGDLGVELDTYVIEVCSGGS
ncbi:hypothetical protein LAWASA_3711 [Lawsonibacter asaccharolyticus]|nr:hypothetical protein LAWASA_3711 [Lawsonibacter asaccharolyticus]